MSNELPPQEGQEDRETPAVVVETTADLTGVPADQILGPISVDDGTLLLTRSGLEAYERLRGAAAEEGENEQTDDDEA